MARYAFFVAPIINLTINAIKAYAYDGSIITLFPEVCLVKVNSDEVYLIDKEQYRIFRYMGVPDSRLVYACNKGTGRDGHVIYQLHTFEQKERRVMPL